MTVAYPGRKSYARLRVESFGMRRLGELTDQEVTSLVVQNAIRRGDRMLSLFRDAVRHEAMRRGLI